ncbi:transglycosylase domain-containing protein [Thalassobacillus hwangdonensis]|uniref:Transglycosylase domain-containing protein n=1 Tax=Thalassobacillus hwangdonensis TaxID=546108 RepID=A0ABW3L3W2_9BACI
MKDRIRRLLSKDYPKWVKYSLISGLCSAALMFLSIATLLVYCLIAGPPSLVTEQNTIYYSADGTVIEEDFGNKRRYWVDLDEISPDIVQATILSEDRNFYDHMGFDLKRITAAALKNIRNLDKIEGASTITQQYARNLYLSHEKTWSRKIKEALYAYRLELFYDKDEILEGYLNTIYYGHGAYGVEAASRYYFSKHADELTLAESAMLAGVPKGPSYYSPFINEQNAEDRQALILSQLETFDYIDKKTAELAANEALSYASQEDFSIPDIAPYFQDVVAQHATRLLGIDREELMKGGYQIHTTLQTDTQGMLEQTMERSLKTNPDIQASAVVTDPHSGAIVAMVGGRDYEDSPYNRATQAKRMVGSTIKPFLYYTALEKGFTATTQLVSKPTDFEFADGEVYAPSNYNGYYADEPITMAQALALSDNIYAVKTNMFLGSDKLVETLHDFGISGKIPSVPSLALGTASISLHDMTDAYTRLASAESPKEAHTITKITDRHGHVLFEHEPEEANTTKLDPDRAFVVSHMMTGMFDSSLNGYMSVTGASIANELTHTYAGKSGTTDTDSWMIGFSPDLVTGVWTGYDDGREMTKIQDHQFAKEIWAGFMEKAHAEKEYKTFKPTDNVIGVYIDPETGMRASPYCPNQRLMYFEKGKEPDQYCGDHYDGKSEKKDKEKEENKRGSWKDLLDWLF